jgi:hypothetical protein
VNKNTQEVWAGPSWSSYALQVRSLLSHGYRLNPLFDPNLYSRPSSSPMLLAVCGRSGAVLTAASTC